jgi:signal transduction histidine kinase
MMSEPRLRHKRPSWLRLPHRTARFRLTVVLGGLFLVSGAALVAITFGLFERATAFTKPRLPEVPRTPAIRDLLSMRAIEQLLGNRPPAFSGFTPKGLTGPKNLQPQLLVIRHLFAHSPLRSNPRLVAAVAQLTGDEHQVAVSQRHLARAVNQLAQAVHQVAQAGAVEAAQRASDAHQLLVNSGIALAIVAVLAVLAGWLVAGRTLRPIRTITRTARRISSTSLHERLALEGPQDELKELGDTLDDLFGRLEDSFEAQRHFVANASHELRTPITADRNLLQVALDDPQTSKEAWRSTARELLASNDEQKHLIEALLALASSESGPISHERVELDSIVTAALVDLQPEADRLGIRIDEATAGAPLDGDPVLLERLVVNLLTNAVCHNEVDGRIEVRTGMDDGRAFLSVTNTGQPIPPEEVGRLFQPFQRLDPRRAHHKDGHGLGLSIVRAIATSHRADITALALPNGGLSVSVTFPPAASPSAFRGTDVGNGSAASRQVLVLGPARQLSKEGYARFGGSDRA